jgi:integrase
MRAKITKSNVDQLRPGEMLVDANPIGFVARRLPSGAVTYGFRFRDKETGKQRWLGLGVHGVDLTPDQARRKALRIAGEVKDGGAPQSAAATAQRRRQAHGVTVNHLLDEFLNRYARPNLRSADTIARVFEMYVRPRIGAKSIYALTRLDVVELLDAAEDQGGPVRADQLLAFLRKALRWWAIRDERFAPPIVPGMARTKPKERARDRILSDDEICSLWAALDTAKLPKRFPALVRTLLLTSQRRDECARMSWGEITGDIWVIPAERSKNKTANLVPLTATVRELLGPPKKTGFIFSNDGEHAPSSSSKAKKILDIEIDRIRKAAGQKPMPNWVLHDLRRTARSLMSRAGVPADHAERVLNHAIPGIRGVYDHHSYQDEKRNALQKLDALVERILAPAPSDTVVRFPEKAG